MSLDGKQGSGPLKPRYKASCRGLRGTGVVIVVSLMIPLGHQAARRIYAFHLYGALRVVTVYFPGSHGTEMEPRVTTKHKAKAKQGGSVTQSPNQKVGSLRQGVSSSDTPPWGADSFSRPEVAEQTTKGRYSPVV
jgi:hypothetical protein